MSSKEAFNSVEGVPGNFEAIETAVMESSRGRWFLEEYAKRQRGRETAALLNAIGKLETALAANQNLIAGRLGQVLGLIPAEKMVASPPELSAEHMKFFKQDEELFEAVAMPATPVAVAAVPLKSWEPKPDMSKGAKLVIRQQTDTGSEAAAAPIEPLPQAAEIPPKSRIVIIRRKAGEAIDVPLHDEHRASA
ncbi:MAG: hypothetical protein ACREDX_08820 [Aestuariivirga sp.]